MKEYIINLITSFGLSPKMSILLLSTLPVTELRASVPIGILLLKENVKIVFFYAIMGNVLPIAPIYFFLEPISKRLSRTVYMRRFFEWLFERAKKRSGLIEKYEAFGLMLFVCIP
ncbi:MAG: small multi-drug export protein, partial [Candidatus Omnitrophica bacterium]|nr:small multi-drug export protein [Candidatus Omnitrophota bacterium]